MKSEKFLITNEAFKIIQSLVSSEKISKQILENFLNENKNEVCALINSTIMLDKKRGKECEHYYVKRESLKFYLTILEDSDNFPNFREFFLNSVENLKLVMGLLNHSCMRIKSSAVEILSLFFSDIDYTRDKKIKSILLVNKKNFENYFSKFHRENDKANFILYHLERLECQTLGGD